MRLFVAVVPPVEAISNLDRVVAAPRAAHPDLQWIPAERWHLTLAFYGEVADRDVARVERRAVRATRGLRRWICSSPARGTSADACCGSGWQGERDGLRALAGALATDGRPYRPHLTVARARGGADPRPAATLLAPYDGPGWRAAEVVLFCSHLGPKPRHEPIARWPLATHDHGSAQSGAG